MNLKPTICRVAVLMAAAMMALTVSAQKVKTGIEMLKANNFKQLEGKRVGLVTNPTGVDNFMKSDIDILHEAKNVKLVALFGPEHGVRGSVHAGDHVGNAADPTTGVPVYSLYGKSRIPSKEMLQGIDVLIYDIQDIGCRSFTYISTLGNIMKAAAENGIKVMVLDRPNPNGMYVDGPLLDMKYKSGVGSLPIPVVHGMTLGELALMINGEGWLKEGRKCDLKVVKCLNYNHQTRYRLPVIPSPNLPNMTSIYLYPSLCYFEATDVSLGRGTDKPFQQFGHPDMKGYAYSFTPESREGAKNPPQLGHTCYGRDLSQMSDDEIINKKLDLTYLIEAYRAVNTGDKFFTSFFEKLIGVDWVRTMIEEGKSADEIRARWMPDVEKFKKQRKPYLLYKE